MKEKKCAHCGQYLDESAFYVDKYGKLNSYCKECRKKISLENYHRAKPKLKAIFSMPSTDLLAELKRRGYSWTDMTVTKHIKPTPEFRDLLSRNGFDSVSDAQIILKIPYSNAEK